MTREETVTIIRAIKASYPTFKPDNLSETVDVWHMMLSDQNYKVISMALKNYIRTNNTGFAPSIGQLMDHTHTITSPDELTGTQAWGLVMKAVRNSGYNSLAEFAKLPETVQKAVGSPEQLKSMALDEFFNETNASKNFMLSYQTIVKREKELQKMPDDVRRLVESMNADTPKARLEQRNVERVERMQSNRLIESKSEEYVPMPEEAMQAMKELLGIE